MVLRTRTVTTLDNRIGCSRCGKTIAAWDAHRECIVFELPRYRVYIEVPGREAVIQCHREVWEGGRFVVCAHVNRIAL